MKNLSRNECPVKLNDCTERVIIKKAKKVPESVLQKSDLNWELIENLMRMFPQLKSFYIVTDIIAEVPDENH